MIQTFLRACRIPFALAAGIIALSAFAAQADAQLPMRLRAQIQPACATTSALKFADIYADGNIAVMGSYNCRGVFIFNISNPDAPVLASWYNPGANLQFLEAIVIGNRGYFGTGNTGGVHIVDLTNPASPQLLGIVNSTNGGGHNTIHEMMVFDQGGQRYLLENSNSTGTGTARDLRIINVTNPAAAVLKWSFQSSDGGWVHAMHIRGNRLFLSGFVSSTRVDIYDMSTLASQAPVLLGSVAVGFNSNHSAWTSEDGNYLYSAREIGDSASANPGDIRVFDVTNPGSAFLVKRVSMNDLGIVAVTPHNPVVMGNKLYVAWYQAGTLVFDITDPSDPVLAGRYDTWPAQFTEEDLREVQQANSNIDRADMMCGTNLRNGQQIAGYNGNWAVFPFLGENKVLLGDLSTGLYVIDITSKNNIADFDGDKKTDFSAFTPATGMWNIENSSNSSASQTNFGFATDKLTPGDYDGDGRADMAIFRPSTGTWWIRRSSNPGNFLAVNFGISTDIPVPGDYDGDGKTDVAVFRPSTGVWYIQQSTAGIRIEGWGLSTDKAFTGDYDGDGKADLAIYRPSTGVWYIKQSSNGSALITPFGLPTDRPVSTDFDGDGRSDIAVYRPSEGNWYYLKSGSSNSFAVVRFGIAEDIPVPADYDGDGKADIAVFRPSSNAWYRLNSTNGSFSVRVFGSGGDAPIPASIQP
ncbi:MAG: VCBS repeat-containing protein [Pyrinomonadaceae bacterium]|nr:VCBS repeat-containing protein [Acidobacteriota bacterium]MBK7934337.1 VCBS repeat-containing protein [Acidobacteriota bacterium]MBP7377925.1 VCBS repeat-containing protein [Pyrinomonadaceae bacterium]